MSLIKNRKLPLKTVNGRMAKWQCAGCKTITERKATVRSASAERWKIVYCDNPKCCFETVHNLL